MRFCACAFALYTMGTLDKKKHPFFLCSFFDTILLNILKLLAAAVVFRAGFNRPNLHYSVCQKPSSTAEFVDLLAKLIHTRFPGLSGIIYCFSRKECEELTKSLRLVLLTL